MRMSNAEIVQTVWILDCLLPSKQPSSFLLTLRSILDKFGYALTVSLPIINRCGKPMLFSLQLAPAHLVLPNRVVVLPKNLLEMPDVFAFMFNCAAQCLARCPLFANVQSHPVSFERSQILIAFNDPGTGRA